MPASNVRRVRSDGFSKNIAICFPASVWRKSSGRAFIMAARWNSDSTSMGEGSRIETRSRPGTVVGAGCATGWAVNGWMLNLVAPFSFLACAGRLRTEPPVERADDCIYVLLLDNVGRQKAQHGVVGAINQDSLL